MFILPILLAVLLVVPSLAYTLSDSGMEYQRKPFVLVPWSFQEKCAIANQLSTVSLRIQLLKLCENSLLPEQLAYHLLRGSIDVTEILGIEKIDESLPAIEKAWAIRDIGIIKELKPIAGSFVEHLYKNLVVADQDKINFAVSPLSLEVILAGVGMGAGSYTQDEIYRVLKVNQDTIIPIYKTKITELELERLTSLKLVTKLFIDESFFPVNQNFKSDLQKHFQMDIESAQFKENHVLEIKKINMYVTSKTYGFIQDAIGKGDINPDTDIILLNTLFFKGKWENPFTKSGGYNGDFKLPRNELVKATYMSRAETASYYKAVPQKKYRMLELPYLQTRETGSYSMIIILPDNYDGLAEVEELLTRDESWLADFDLRSSRDIAMVKPTIPRFKIDMNIDLRSSLNNMGVTTIFENSADLRGITNKKNLKIAKIYQRVYIEVNEIGTTMSAAMTDSGAPTKNLNNLPTFDFVADHPFLFALIERNTKTVLFIGHVTHPDFDNLFGTIQEETQIETPTTADR